MNLSSGMFTGVFAMAIFFAIAWLEASSRAAKLKATEDELKREAATLRHRMDRVSRESETDKVKISDQRAALADIGAALGNVANPMGTLRRIYEIVEKEDLSLVQDSPLAFANQQGGKAFQHDPDDTEVFQRIRHGMGG